MRVEKLLVTQLVNCINENKDDIGLPCYVTFGAPQTLTGEAMWLQTLGGTREIKKYIRGKYNGELSFAVYYRLSAVQMDGIEANLIVPHEQLSEWFDDIHNTPVFDGLTVEDICMTKQPSLFRKTEDGEVTYQSIWVMTYKN